jgi:hypothetical protein
MALSEKEKKRLREEANEALNNAPWSRPTVEASPEEVARAMAPFGISERGIVVPDAPPPAAPQAVDDEVPLPVEQLPDEAMLARARQAELDIAHEAEVERRLMAEQRALAHELGVRQEGVNQADAAAALSGQLSQLDPAAMPAPKQAVYVDPNARFNLTRGPGPVPPPPAPGVATGAAAADVSRARRVYRAATGAAKGDIDTQRDMIGDFATGAEREASLTEREERERLAQAAFEANVEAKSAASRAAEFREQERLRNAASVKVGALIKDAEEKHAKVSEIANSPLDMRGLLTKKPASALLSIGAAIAEGWLGGFQGRSITTALDAMDDMISRDIDAQLQTRDIAGKQATGLAKLVSDLVDADMGHKEAAELAKLKAMEWAAKSVAARARAIGNEDGAVQAQRKAQVVRNKLADEKLVHQDKLVKNTMQSRADALAELESAQKQLAASLPEPTKGSKYAPLGNWGRVYLSRPTPRLDGAGNPVLGADGKIIYDEAVIDDVRADRTATKATNTAGYIGLLSKMQKVLAKGSRMGEDGRPIFSIKALTDADKQILLGYAKEVAAQKAKSIDSGRLSDDDITRAEQMVQNITALMTSGLSVSEVLENLQRNKKDAFDNLMGDLRVDHADVNEQAARVFFDLDWKFDDHLKTDPDGMVNKHVGKDGLIKGSGTNPGSRRELVGNLMRIHDASGGRNQLVAIKAIDALRSAEKKTIQKLERELSAPTTSKNEKRLRQLIAGSRSVLEVIDIATRKVGNPEDKKPVVVEGYVPSRPN